MIIYADVLFAINFSMDFLALFLLAQLSHLKIFKHRIVFAATLGGLYGAVAIIVSVNYIAEIILSILVAISMCIICYKIKKPKQLLASVLLYLFISASLGGIMSLLYSIFNKFLAKVIENHSYETVYSSARGFIILGLTAIIAIIFTRVLSHKKDVKTMSMSVKLLGETYSMQGLCDSGNLLTEPFSGKRVILVSSCSELGEKIDGLKNVKKRCIPYKDVNGTGIIKGVFAEEIFVGDKRVDAILATVNNNGFDGNEALIPYAII